jgi:predicted choloylglycine hydrolase
VSLTFGGRTETGDGFGIPLIMRYVLQVARSTGEAVRILQRVPSHMSYNVLVLDGAGQHALVELAPLSVSHGLPEPASWQNMRRHPRPQQRRASSCFAHARPQLPPPALRTIG